MPMVPDYVHKTVPVVSNPLHSIHPSICVASCRVCLQPIVDAMRSVHVFQRHSDIHMPTEPSNAAARGITKERVHSPCPTSVSGTIPDISTWKLPPCQVKLFVEARRHHGGSRAVERPPEALRPCAPRSPRSAAHSTQPNNPPRGAWPLGCPSRTPPRNKPCENRSWVTPN